MVGGAERWGRIGTAAGEVAWNRKPQCVSDHGWSSSNFIPKVLKLSFLNRNTGFAGEYWKVLFSILLFKPTDRDQATTPQSIGRREGLVALSYGGRKDYTADG